MQDSTQTYARLFNHFRVHHILVTATNSLQTQTESIKSGDLQNATALLSDMEIFYET